MKYPKCHCGGKTLKIEESDTSRRFKCVKCGDTYFKFRPEWVNRDLGGNCYANKKT
jgi:hypothetical protein